MISARDELVNLRNQISQMNYRINRLAALSTPATDPSQFAFMDHFSDADIFYAWKVLNTIVGIKTIVEAGSVLTFGAVAADCRWTTAVNGAPKISIGHPGLPCEIVTKINSVGAAFDALVHAGLYVGIPEGTSAYSGVMFGRRNTGLYCYQMDGTSNNLVAVLTLPIWLKMRISAAFNQGYRVSFQYSTDGVVWTTYQSIPPSDFYWWGGTAPAYPQNIGLVLRSTAINCSATIPFEFFQATRIFGPGGV